MVEIRVQGSGGEEVFLTEVREREQTIEMVEGKYLLTPKDILLLLLYVPGQTKKYNEEIEGKLRFAKMVFLLKLETSIKSSVKKFYSDFAAQDYGPYSNEFDLDLRELKEKGLIMEVTTEVSALVESTVSRTDYRLTEKGVEYCRNLAKNVDRQTLAEITDIKKKFNSMTVETLVNYVYWKYPDYTKASKIKKMVY